MRIELSKRTPDNGETLCNIKKEIEQKQEEIKKLEDILIEQNQHHIENWKGLFQVKNNLIRKIQNTTAGVLDQNDDYIIYPTNIINIEYFNNSSVKLKLINEFPYYSINSLEKCTIFENIYEDYIKNKTISLKTAQRKGIISKNINLEKFGIPFSYVARCKNVKYIKQQEDNLTVNFYKESDIKYILEEMGLNSEN